MFQILSAKVGLCILCRGKASKEKEVFTVKGPVNGALCPDHLYALAEQKKENNESPEASLFNGRVG